MLVLCSVFMCEEGKCTAAVTKLQTRYVRQKLITADEKFGVRITLRRRIDKLAEVSVADEGKMLCTHVFHLPR